MSTNYTLIAKKLYKMGKATPILMIVWENVMRLVLMEVHTYVYGSHIGVELWRIRGLQPNTIGKILLRICSSFNNKCPRFSNLLNSFWKILYSLTCHNHSICGELTFWDHSPCLRVIEILTCSRGLFLQVDWGTYGMKAQCKKSQVLLLDANHLSVWVSEMNHLL